MILHVSYTLGNRCTVKIKREDYTVVDWRYYIPRREAEEWAERRLEELKAEKQKGG